MAENIEHPTLRPEPPCTCTIVDERFWFSHYGAIEPGSMMEFDPECPEHRRDDVALLAEDAGSEEHDPPQEQPDLMAALQGFIELDAHLDDWAISAAPDMELPSTPIPAFREGSQEILSGPS